MLFDLSEKTVDTLLELFEESDLDISDISLFRKDFDEAVEEFKSQIIHVGDDVS